MAIVDDVAIALGVLFIATVIACRPYIEQAISVVTTTISVWVTSFWGWLKGLFVKQTVVTTTVNTIVHYRADVFGRTFELDKVGGDEKEKPRREGNYYLAAILNGFVYISLEAITEAEAVAVLSAGRTITINDVKYQLNTYTFTDEMALNIALQAATFLGLTGAVSHGYHGVGKTGTYFMHYHPGGDYVSGSPHSLYGFPKIRL